MKVLIKPVKTEYVPSIEAISSKSYVHRMLIAMALSGCDGCLKVNMLSEDMKATVRALNDMGFDVEVNDNIIYVNQNGKRNESQTGCDDIDSVDGKKDETVRIYCNESGSTARFLLPVAAALFESAQVSGSEGLSKRPFKDLCVCLNENGTKTDSFTLPVTTCGKLKAGEFRIPGDVSSQYISGLMFALPLLGADSRIMLTTELKSESYIEITKEVLQKFGINILKDGNTFVVKGSEHYSRPSDSTVEGDWSNAAFPLCMGALNEGVMLTNLNPVSVQGDRKIADILASMGADISFTGNNLKLRSGRLTGIRTDLSDIPDMAPALAMISMFAEGDSYLTNAERLRIKESDRVAAIEMLLKAFGCEYSLSDENNLTIRIGNIVKLTKENAESDDIYSGGDFVHIDSMNDHRIVMAACIGAVGSGKKTVIANAEAVNKSYPGFFDDMKDFFDYEIIED